jgi:uncharacterized HAD superfamily protein
MKIILCDVDETIIKFADPFQDWIEQQGIVHDGSRLIDHYSVEKFLNCDSGQATRIIKEFGKSTIGMNQPPEDCALDVLPRLYQDGYRFHAISACGLDEHFRLDRHQILERIFGIPWENVLTVDYGSTKMPHLEKFDPAIWVEDNLKHAVAGASHGHRTFLIDRAYNKGDNENVRRVKNWREIERILKHDPVA